MADRAARIGDDGPSWLKDPDSRHTQRIHRRSAARMLAGAGPITPGVLRALTSAGDERRRACSGDSATARTRAARAGPGSKRLRGGRREPTRPSGRARSRIPVTSSSSRPSSSCPSSSQPSSWQPLGITSSGQDVMLPEGLLGCATRTHVVSLVFLLVQLACQTPARCTHGAPMRALHRGSSGEKTFARIARDSRAHIARTRALSTYWCMRDRAVAKCL